MEELARRFRQEAGQREGLRYSQELRQLAVQYAASTVGLSRRQIAAALGLNEATLIRWQGSEPVARCAPAALHEVVVVDQAGRSQPVLVMPSGVRVEGLSVGELVSMLEALG